MKASLGEVLSAREVANELNRQGNAKYIELNLDDHQGAGLLVWTMDDDTSSPKCEAKAHALVRAVNEDDSMLKLSSELSELRRLHHLLWSYNPSLPMGDGMAARFFEIMLQIERAKHAD